jgi:hypothetical protein
MLTYRGGQKVGKGTYWDLRNGHRIDVSQEDVLRGGAASTYLRMPPGVVPLLGPITGLLYVVLFPFIGLAVVLMAAGRRVAEGMVSLVEKNISFHWRPRDAYLTGKKKEKPKGKSGKK